MKLQSVQPKTFAQLFEVLKEHKPDILVHFHPDSIKIFASDVGKTSIAYVTLWGKTLEHYECDRHQPVGVNTPRLHSTLKVASADDILVMEFDEKKEEALNISIIDGKSKAAKFTTGYITYNCEDEILPLPDNVNSNSCISMNSHNFYSNLKTMEGMECEYVTLKQCTSPSGGYRLSLVGVGSQFHRNPCINIDEDAASAKTSNPLEEISLCFPLKKLVQFAKAYVLDEKVAIHLKKEGLLILQYKIKIYGELQFLIMSTNDDDDEDEKDSDQEEDDDEDNVQEEGDVQENKKRTATQGGNDGNENDGNGDEEEETHANMGRASATRVEEAMTVATVATVATASTTIVPKKKAAPPALKKVKL